MMGRHSRLPVDTILDLEEGTPNGSLTDYVEQHIERLRDAYRKAGEQLKQAARNKKRTVEANSGADNFKPGTLVLIRNRVTETQSRMHGVNTTMKSLDELTLRSTFMRFVGRTIQMMSG